MLLFLHGYYYDCVAGFAGATRISLRAIVAGGTGRARASRCTCATRCTGPAVIAGSPSGAGGARSSRNGHIGPHRASVACCTGSTRCTCGTWRRYDDGSWCASGIAGAQA